MNPKVRVRIGPLVDPGPGGFGTALLPSQDDHKRLQMAEDAARGIEVIGRA